MTKQKKGFWTFFFSLIPGAGEMYMGFMKCGLSIMTVFWLLIGFAGWFDSGIFIFGLPVLWFYSFFHVHNLKSLSEEEFYSITDEYAFHLEEIFANRKSIFNKHRNAVVIFIFFLGFSILWSNTRSLMYFLMPDYFSRFYDVIVRIPEFTLGLGFIVFGIWLIREKKKELDENEKE